MSSIRERSGGPGRARSGRLSAAAAWVVAISTSLWALAAVSLLGVAALLEMENEWFTMPFSVSVLLVLAALFHLVSRRIAFSLYAAWAVLGTVTLISFVKFREQGFSLHAYDIVFVGGDPSLYLFLLKDYMHLALPVLGAAAAALVALAAIALHEPARHSTLRARLLALVGLAVLLPVTIPATAAADRHEYIVGGHHASAFFVSLLDVANLFSESELQQRILALPPEEPFADAVACAPEARRPDVFAVLSETQSPPFRTPGLGVGPGFADGFTSDDGKLHELRVETFGGGTWISNFSLMTGLSAADFGWERPYVTIALQGRVGGSLPALLARCGYRTVAMLPMDHSFVNEGPFLESIGFDTVLDRTDLGDLDGVRRRDSFYFEAAERLLAEHRRQDGRPLFLLIQTMFPHGPHNERIDPASVAEGEPLHTDPEIAEYLRRVYLARQDFHGFLDALRAAPGQRGSVVLEFGDHQAGLIMPFVERVEGAGALGNPDSTAFLTHYSVHSFGYAMPGPLPAAERLDIAYLGASLLQAAGMATSPLVEDLLRLRDLCAGRFHTCHDRAVVDRHLRRRIDSGFLGILDDAGS